MSDERHRVTVLRSRPTLRDPSQMEADALSGIGSIPGASDVQIEAVDSGSVMLSYLWSGAEQFERTDEHLAQYGLRKQWKNEE